MFCPECGTKNADDGRFCENCGAKLEHPQSAPTQNVQPNINQTQATPVMTTPPAPKPPRKPMPLAAKLIIILVLVLIAAGTGGYFVLKSLTNPKNIVTDYAKAYVSHDAKALFKSLDFKESPFVTVEKFETALKSDSNKHFEDSTDYTITENESNDTKNSTLRYDVVFRDDSNAFEYDTEIVLNKLSTKSYLFFDNWKIKTEGFLAKDCAVNVPSGAAVTIDDVKLTDTYKTESEEEGIDTYKINYIFSGKHTLKLSLENYNDYEVSFTLNSTDYEGQTVTSVNRSDLTLSDDIANTLVEQSKTTLTKLYEAALDKKEFEDILSADEVEDTSLEDLKSKYKSLVEYNIEGDPHLKSVDFSSMEGEAQIAYNYNDDCTAVSVNLETEYTAKSVVKNFWDKKKSTKSYDGSSNFTFTYHFKNGKWVLNDSTAFNYCVYYTKN